MSFFLGFVLFVFILQRDCATSRFFALLWRYFRKYVGVKCPGEQLQFRTSVPTSDKKNVCLFVLSKNQESSDTVKIVYITETNVFKISYTYYKIILFSAPCYDERIIFKNSKIL